MASEVVMPRLSDTMDSGKVAKWLKQVGDSVKRGEVIAEIETDKANMDLEAYATGILARIIVSEGESVGLGEPIAVIAANAEEAAGMGDNSSAGPGSNASPASSAPINPSGGKSDGADRTESGSNGTKPDSADAGGRIKASPLARRLASERGIDLARVSGTGPGGRITKEDVQAFAPSAPAEAPIETPQTVEDRDEAQPEQSSQPVPASAQTTSVTAARSDVRAGSRAEMTRMQTTIARRMAQAKHSAPEFVLTAEYDMTEARALLRSISAIEDAPKVGPNDLLIKAVASALKLHPEVNSGWEDDGIVQYGRVNVGNAVAIKGGLVVPVIQDADLKTLGQIAVESKAAIEKARANKLIPAEYEGGTFSISNLGMYGIDQFTPIINVPEACILGVGAITPTPVVVNGEVVIRDRMKVTMSCDHRVVNGAQGAEFLRTLRRFLENPVLSVL